MTPWPELPLDEWNDTRETLHRWTQIVGKIRLALTPLVNHWWNVPLYVTGRGLSTSTIPYGDRWFDMELDFLSHVLRVRTSDGAAREIALRPRSVADLYAEVFEVLRALDIECTIWTTPVEIGNPIPLDTDTQHHSYDPDAVRRFWTILARTHALFTAFRARFIGKCSPVHFFWGSFDLAVTRFSGRVAPPRPEADAITREAYSHEVSSAGFWPGDPERLPQASFYCYAAPEPAGYRDAKIPPPAYYDTTLAGFYLRYDDFRALPYPDSALLDFCQATYASAADLGHWDRAALERK